MEPTGTHGTWKLTREPRNTGYGQEHGIWTHGTRGPTGHGHPWGTRGLMGNTGTHGTLELPPRDTGTKGHGTHRAQNATGHGVKGTRNLRAMQNPTGHETAPRDPTGYRTPHRTREPPRDMGTVGHGNPRGTEPPTGHGTSAGPHRTRHRPTGTPTGHGPPWDTGTAQQRTEPPMKNIPLRHSPPVTRPPRDTPPPHTPTRDALRPPPQPPPRCTGSP